MIFEKVFALDNVSSEQEREAQDNEQEAKETMLNNLMNVLLIELQNTDNETYQQTSNIENREKIIHKVLGSAKLNIEIMDRFGNPVSPQEWFLVPVFIIDEVVDKIREGTIGDYVYDIENAKLMCSVSAPRI